MAKMVTIQKKNNNDKSRDVRLVCQTVYVKYSKRIKFLLSMSFHGSVCCRAVLAPLSNFTTVLNHDYVNIIIL